MIEIPSAVEARSMSKDCEKAIDEELSLIRDRIIEEISKGGTSITVGGTLLPFVKYHLRHKGYDVSEIGGFIESDETIISWSQGNK